MFYSIISPATCFPRCFEFDFAELCIYSRNPHAESRAQILMFRQKKRKIRFSVLPYHVLFPVLQPFSTVPLIVFPQRTSAIVVLQIVLDSLQGISFSKYSEEPCCFGVFF